MLVEIGKRFFQTQGRGHSTKVCTGIREQVQIGQLQQANHHSRDPLGSRDQKLWPESTRRGTESDKILHSVALYVGSVDEEIWQDKPV